MFRQTLEADRAGPRTNARIESAVTWLYIASVKLMSRRLAAV
jgi:hypothetical protein